MVGRNTKQLGHGGVLPLEGFVVGSKKCVSSFKSKVLQSQALLVCTFLHVAVLILAFYHDAKGPFIRCSKDVIAYSHTSGLQSYELNI